MASSESLTQDQLLEMVTVYQHWAGVATLLRCPLRLDMGDTDIGLVGFPYSGGNTIDRMQYLRPARRPSTTPARLRS